MKPNFALTLSLGGIALLHRVPDGWRLIDEIAPDDPALDQRMEMMRATAVRLADGQFATKLVIADEQIKYVSVDVPAGAERDAVVQAAVERATPYALEDLAFDATVVGSPVTVAIVARETLDEAEDFAQRYRFNPVSFVAAPEEDAVTFEPFFGTTSVAAEILGPDDTLERDIIPVDRIDMPASAPADVAAPEAEQTDEAADDYEDIWSDVFDEEKAADPAAAETPPSDSDVGAAELPLMFTHTEVKRPAPAAVDTIGEGTVPEDPTAPAPVAAPADPEELPDAAALSSSLSDAPRPADAPSRKPMRAQRNDAPRATSPAKAAKPIAVDPQERQAEAARLTVFGAREKTTKVGGKPRYLGLILTVILLATMAGVAAWASTFVDEISRLFGRPSEVVEIADATALQPREITLASLEQSDRGEAVILRGPNPEEMADMELVDTGMPDEQAQLLYATSGIWQKAPGTPRLTLTDRIDGLYVASIDPPVQSHDAVALIDGPRYLTDDQLRAPASPLPANTAFDVDARGLVVATAQGALTPEGVLVILGKPPFVPTPRPAALEPVQRPDPRVAGHRPLARPGALVEQTERDFLGGQTRQQLAAVRPKMRPAAAKEVQEQDQAPSALTLAGSAKPKARPRGFAKIVAAAKKSPVVAASAAAVITPRNPTRASVARQATVKNAINLRRVNLIGVYGKPSKRRALVRLANGRYVKVKVGDKVDGGRVASIGDSELRYVKSGRKITLRMPKG